jgi:hypothetical protein
MGKPPLKRLYFDTNAAYRWPNPSDQFWQMLNLSGYVNTELYFPATVEAELEAQFLRRVDELAKSLRSSYRELKTACFNTIDVTAARIIPNESVSKSPLICCTAMNPHKAIVLPNPLTV